MAKTKGDAAAALQELLKTNEELRRKVDATGEELRAVQKQAKRLAKAAPFFDLEQLAEKVTELMDFQRQIDTPLGKFQVSMQGGWKIEPTIAVAFFPVRQGPGQQLCEGIVMTKTKSGWDANTKTARGLESLSITSMEWIRELGQAIEEAQRRLKEVEQISEAVRPFFPLAESLGIMVSTLRDKGEEVK